jgi:hypothetical protein
MTSLGNDTLEIVTHSNPVAFLTGCFVSACYTWLPPVQQGGALQ